MRHFFCKYNDPLYVKMEKLAVLVMLAQDDNVDAVLLELKEYAGEVNARATRPQTAREGEAARNRL